MAAPVPVTDLAGVTRVSMRGQSACALRSNQTVWCWGANARGQLGDGSTTQSSVPVQVSEITNAIAVSVGIVHACALLATGHVVCWGDDVDGQLGDGGTTYSSTPVEASGIATAKALTAGNNHTCAVLAAGAPRCWGGNAWSQLADGTMETQRTPVPFNGAGIATDSIKALAAGPQVTCILQTDNAVACIGNPYTGMQTGGTITGATEISVGGTVACALLGNGTITCWGGNSYGLLNTSGTYAAGSLAVGSNHACVVTYNLSAECWGANEFGQLGIGSTDFTDAPAQVLGIGGTGVLGGVKAVSAGGYHTWALMDSGTIACWGRGDYAEIGDGSGANFSAPVLVSGITTATAVAAGDVHTCAVLTGGSVKCWGAGNNGRLGTGSYEWAYTPAPVSGLANAVSLAAGGAFTCAVLATGGLSCWGSNAVGQYGLDPVSDPETTTPVTVPGVTTATAVTAGFTDTCILLTAGTVTCFTAAADVTAGDGSIAGAVSVAAGQGHACVALADGSVRCWGANDSGQLGNGTLVDSSSPVLTSPGTGAIAYGSNQVCVRGTDSLDNLTSPVACATLTVPDGVKPVFTTPVTVTPRAGVQLTGAGATSTLPVVVSWAATDNDAVARYTLERRTGAGAWTAVKLASSSATSYATTVPTSGTVAFRVTAYDAATPTPNSATSASAALSARLVQQTSTAITWKGAWSAYSLAGLSGGSDKWAKASGATATISFTGRSIGFVSMRGTGRGYVSIYVDGKLAARVSLYRSTSQVRYIAWSRAWASSGSHTVKLVVAGTAGKPRVDLDAFVTIK